MRITNAMMAGQFLSDANASLNRVGKYQNQLDSSKRITRISDDPQATMTALKARNRLSNLSLYQSNIATANSCLSEAETAADGLDEILQSVYGQLVSAQSGAKNKDELANIAEEIRTLMEEVVSIGNTGIGTSYIFGGYNYTGSDGGPGRTAPFSVDETTGDLLYNGVNLSQLAWSEDFSADTALMSDFAEDILDQISALSSALTDGAAMSAVSDALDSASDLVARCGSALQAAKEYGVDTGSPDYLALSGFLEDFSDLYAQLENARAKEPAGDYILTGDPSIVLTGDGEIDYDYYEQRGVAVMTDEEYANCFDPDECRTILDGMAALFAEQYDGGGNPIGSAMDQAVEGLAAAVAVPADVRAALDAEAGCRTKLQVGQTQTVTISFTGFDILGEGSDNVYHLLGKCASMLEGDLDADALGGMISELQDAQSRVLAFETRIGSTQNRLSLIGSRYGNSEINYTTMKSEAEDADLAEATINFKTAQTVYSAALAAGAELIQTSLIDFLR